MASRKVCGVGEREEEGGEVFWMHDRRVGW